MDDTFIFDSIWTQDNIQRLEGQQRLIRILQDNLEAARRLSDGVNISQYQKLQNKLQHLEESLRETAIALQDMDSDVAHANTVILRAIQAADAESITGFE